MEKDLLSEVIGVEKEIQRCLELEKARSREWLDRTKREFEEELTREETGAAEALRRSLDEAKRDAELGSRGVVKQAELAAGRISSLQNGALARIVNRHLNKILPE
jgi:hypothetical protein